MSVVNIMVGLPGSGKSTRAKELAGAGAMIVSKDSIREMVYGRYQFVKEDEQLIEDIAKSVMCSMIIRKKDIVVDETNLTVKGRNKIRALTSGLLCDTVIHYFKTDPQECIKRRTKDTKGYTSGKWVEVITDMKDKLEEPTAEEGCVVVH